MTKTLQNYFDNPSKDCKNWVNKQQKKNGSLRNDEERKRLTKVWMDKEKKRRQNRGANLKSTKKQ